MKKIALLFVALLFVFNGFAGEDITFFRNSFESIKDKASAEKFLATEITEPDYKSAVTINSYKAVCKMMMAQYVYNPFSKYSWFNKGKDLLETTINLNRNVENVYLRLIVQLNVPSFLGYTDEIKEDTEFIKNNIEDSTIPYVTKQYILKNLINTGEVESLKSLAEKYEVI